MSNLSYPKEWLGIANRALNLIGVEPIQTLSDGGAAAQNINVQLPEAVQEVIGYHPFRCTRKRTSLAPSVDAPAFGYDYSYPLPSDYCSLIRVYSDDVILKEGEYERENGAILTDYDELNIIYSALPATPANLNAPVQTAIMYRLAYMLAQILTSNDALIARLYQEYQTALVEAVKRDNQGMNNKGGETWWTDERED